MTKSTIFLFFFLVSAYSFGQVGSPAKDNLPNIIPASPNATAFEKFGSIPVDYSTGVPSISYPIWSWQRGMLQLNVGLNYHAGGVKVDDIASIVGLGWALNCGGQISRTVRGLPDEDPIKGYINTPGFPLIGTFGYHHNEYYYTSTFPSQQEAEQTLITPLNVPYSSMIKQINDRQYDSQQDIFSYSMGSSSGRFIIDKNAQVVPLERTNNKIEIHRYNNLIGSIDYFQITDDKGIVFKFEHREIENTQNLSTSLTLEPNSIIGCTSSWLLTKIINPSTLDSIVLNYANNNIYFETSFGESQSYKVKTIPGPDQTGNGLVPSESVFSYTKINTNQPSLQSINFPDGSVMNFEYLFTRADLANSKGLTKISVVNYRNEFIKTFQLNYSYFSSGPNPNFPSWANSSNDYNKRLRLDSIREVSSDGNAVKPTTFTYNTTVINPRASKNIDFWGYNVSPIRNNTTYIPTQPLEQTERDMISPPFLYIPGADKRPDETFVKAGVLEKITYPTGGFTSFDYECHKAFSPVNYYVNELHSNPLEWLENQFNQTKNIGLTSRTTESVEFYFKAEEFDPRPPYDPNQFQACFENGQDLTPASFEISSTNGIFSTITISDTYGSLHEGVTKIIDLPLGQNYAVKFIYNSGLACAYTYPFKTTITTKYYTVPHDKLVGGLRIKKITNNDGLANILTKEFNYNNLDGNSSATLTTVPSFGYSRSTVDASMLSPAGGNPYIKLEDNINLNSGFGNSLNYFNGAPLIYTSVKEIESDGSLTERHYDPLIFGNPGNYTDIFPWLPIQDFNNLSGMITSEIIKDKFDVIKSETNYTYDKYKSWLIGDDLTVNNNRNLVVNVVASSVGTIVDPYNYDATYYTAYPYYWFITDCKLLTVQKNIYEGNIVLAELTTNTYDPTYHYLLSTTTTNSKQEELRVEYSYPFMFGTSNTVMIQNNMLNYVMKTQVSKSPYQTNSVLSTKKTNYQTYYGILLPLPGDVQSSTLSNALNTDITFNNYDEKGNLLQFTSRDGIFNSFVWGYNKQYPVAKIIGRAYSDVIAAANINMNIINNPVSDNAIRTELNKFRTLDNCMVSTYIYKPLVGVTSETDPNGIITFYEYDNFNRLSLVRDQDQNILKKICYNYYNQAEACPVDNARPEWVATGNTRCQPCPADNNYPSNIREREEKNVNPNSGSTYNTTRWVAEGPGTCTSSPDWQRSSQITECEQGLDRQYTGNEIVIQTDQNPCSETYSQARQVLIPNPGLCISCTGVCPAPEYKCISGQCMQGVWSVVGAFRSGSYDEGQWNCVYAYCFPDGSVSNYRVIVATNRRCTITCY